MQQKLLDLHAEIERLLWTAICMKDMKISSIVFETDCLDLADMTTSPMDWSVFASEINRFWSLHNNYKNMSLYHIFQSDGRADQQAK